VWRQQLIDKVPNFLESFELSLNFFAADRPMLNVCRWSKTFLMAIWYETFEVRLKTFDLKSRALRSRRPTKS
jgi:hypothetical protein